MKEPKGTIEDWNEILERVKNTDITGRSGAYEWLRNIPVESVDYNCLEFEDSAVRRLTVRRADDPAKRVAAPEAEREARRACAHLFGCDLRFE